MADNCIDCGTELKLMFDDLVDSTQYDNALEICFVGGYGMFIDPCDEPGPTVWLCHECAHKTCVTLPWLGKLLQPESSHAHRIDWWKDNMDHVGWDHPDRDEEV